MKTYFWDFVNFEQNDWARFLPMAEFAYNIAKNTSIGHTPFELNCGYYFRISYKKDIDPCSHSKTVNKLSTKLKKLIIVYQKNLYHTQKLQKQA